MSRREKGVNIGPYNQGGITGILMGRRSGFGHQILGEKQQTEHSYVLMENAVYEGSNAFRG